jgi:hypothetical protein
MRRLALLWRSTTRSPMWCGTSCASTAREAITPRRMSAMKAEAIRMPSPKQCTLSPVSTAQPPPGCGHGRERDRGAMACAWPCAWLVPVLMGMVMRAAGRRVVVVFVPVVPQLGLVQQEEEHQPHQQREEQVVGTGLALERLGQQVHEGGGQQGARGQAQHVLGVARQCAKTQGRGNPHAADAGGQGADPDCYQ